MADPRPSDTLIEIHYSPLRVVQDAQPTLPPWHPWLDRVPPRGIGFWEDDLDASGAIDLREPEE